MVKIIKKAFKAFLIILSLLVLLALSFTFAIQSTNVQTFIAKKGVGWLNNNFDIDAEIGKFSTDLIESFHLKNVLIKDHIKDTLFYAEDLSFSIHDLIGLEFKKLELESKRITLNKPYINIQKYEQDSLTNLDIWLQKFSSSKDNDTSKYFIWLHYGSVINGRINYRLKELNNTSKQIDYQNFKCNNLNLDISNLKVYPKNLVCTIDSLRFNEKTGFEIQNLSTNLAIKKDRISLDYLHLRTDKSSLACNAKMWVKNTSQLKTFNDSIPIDFSIKNSNLHSDDLSYFTKEVDGLNKKIDVKGEVNGTVNKLNVKNLEIKYGTSTKLKIDGNILNIASNYTPSVDLKIYKLFTTYTDLKTIPNYPFNEGKLLPLPTFLNNSRWINYRGIIKGKNDHFNVLGLAETPLGNLNTNLRITENNNQLKYEGGVHTKSFQLGKLVNEKNIGDISFDVQMDATQNKLDGFVMNLDGDIHFIQLKGYEYQEIQANGVFKNKNFAGTASIEDPNLNLSFDGNLDFSKSEPIYIFKAQVNEANLSALGLVPKEDDIHVKGKIGINMIGDDIDHLKGNLGISEFLFKQNQDTLHLKHVDLISIDDKFGKALKFDSDYLTFTLLGQYNLASLWHSIYNLVAKSNTNLITDQKGDFDNSMVQDISFQLQLKNSMLLQKMLFPEHRIKGGIIIGGNYKNQEEKLELKISSDYFRIDKQWVSDIEFQANIDGGIIDFIGTANKIQVSDSLLVEGVMFFAKSFNNNVESDLSWKIKNNKTIEGGEFSALTKIYSPYHFDFNLFNSKVNLYDTLWEIEPNNAIVIDSSQLEIRNFSMINGDRSVTIDGVLSPNPANKLKFTFHDFNLKALNGFLREEEIQLDGDVNGEAMISFPNKKLNFTSLIDVEHLTFNDQNFGNGKVNAAWVDFQQKISINASLSEQSKKTLALMGGYYPYRDENSLELMLTLYDFNLVNLNSFTKPYVSELAGDLTGAALISGTLEKPLIKGKLYIKEVDFLVDYLNSKYRIENQKIRIEDDWIGFDNISIFDSRGKPAKTTGTIFHENYSNFNFDILIEASDFQVLNTNKIINPYYYGTANMSGDINVSGFAENLIIELNAKPEKNTKFYLPLTYGGDVVEADFIQFINTDTSKVIQDDNYSVDLSGIQLNMNLDVNENMESQIIFDDVVGDVMKAKGEGSVQVSINPSGDLNMYGEYVINEGDYLFTLENIINKRFRIRKGSKLTWNGDPLEAEMDVVTYYKTRSSLENLIKSIDSTQTARRVPVEVTMNLKNDLTNPFIDFNIELPSVDENTQSIVNSLITTEEEMNRQVFGLLMMNKFLPLEQGITSGNPVQSSTSDLLANQLTNLLSKSKLSEYVEIGVNELSAEEVELALSKRFLNDRIVIAGNFGNTGQQNSSISTDNGANNLVGEFNLEYLITDDGKIRANAFRKYNNYSTSYTANSKYTEGVGVFYRKEFSKWREFFKRKKTKD